jgi:3-oxoadipate enol-lactonase
MPEVKLVSSMEGPRDAPVLVLGNPIGTNRDIWSHQLPVLSRYFRILRFEPRGHGAPGTQSPAPKGPYTIADLGGDVLAVANAHGIQRFAYAGVSLGGMTGIWLAANAPERITALAVCCAALTALPNPQSWHDRAALVRAEGMAPLAGMVVPRWFTPAFMTREPAAVRAVVDMLKATNPEGYAGCGEAIAALDLRPLLGCVRAPTLVLSGAEDVAAPPRSAPTPPATSQAPAWPSSKPPPTSPATRSRAPSRTPSSPTSKAPTSKARVKVSSHPERSRVSPRSHTTFAPAASPVVRNRRAALCVRVTKA